LSSARASPALHFSLLKPCLDWNTMFSLTHVSGHKNYVAWKRNNMFLKVLWTVCI
jgi:hypothetical protein